MTSNANWCEKTRWCDDWKWDNTQLLFKNIAEIKMANKQEKESVTNRVILYHTGTQLQFKLKNDWFHIFGVLLKLTFSLSKVMHRYIQ